MCGRTAWLRARRGEKPAALVGLCNRRGRRGNLSLAGIAGARSGTGHEFRLDDRIMRRAGPGGAGMRMAAVETHPFFVTQTFSITRDWLLGTNHWGEESVILTTVGRKNLCDAKVVASSSRPFRKSDTVKKRGFLNEFSMKFRPNLTNFRDCAFVSPALTRVIPE